MSALTELEDLLKRTMGLDAASIGSSAIESAVRNRLAACQLPGVDAYREFVGNSEQELQELIEAIVVPETWFFRDAEAFAALARMVRDEWLPKHATGALRLLSVPCSTGEEPYSIAMTLLDAGLPPDRFRIDAIDISQRVIAAAHAGVYGRNSFRGSELAFRERHFAHTALGYRIAAAVREPVQFRQGNLLDAEFAARSGGYDAIFCRNVLIYFDTPTQRHALGVLERLLLPDGRLFVAPAESGLLLAYDFKPVHGAAACVFQKLRDPRPLPKPVPRTEPLRHFAMPAPPLPPRAQPSATMPARGAPTADAASVDRALRLADQGRLGEAAQCARECLDRNGPSAAAFHALGLISDASSNALDAAMYYRKALYLDPQHREALLHLALTLEHLGDAANAQVFRNRARRVEARGKPG